MILQLIKQMPKTKENTPMVWKPMDTNEFPWLSMNPPGPRETGGYPWIPMDINEFPGCPSCESPTCGCPLASISADVQAICRSPSRGMSKLQMPKTDVQAADAKAIRSQITIMNRKLDEY